jgi:hypothetical protein
VPDRYPAIEDHAVHAPGHGGAVFTSPRAPGPPRPPRSPWDRRYREMVERSALVLKLLV